jgi:hypothetical protein
MLFSNVMSNFPNSKVPYPALVFVLLFFKNGVNNKAKNQEKKKEGKRIIMYLQLCSFEVHGVIQS